MTETRIRRTAAGLLGTTGALHLVLAPEYLDEETYVGALFILGGLAALAVAARLWSTDDRRAWGLGAVIAAGMAVGFVLSRSVGLPGFHEHEWELSGIVSVLIELGFLGTLALYARGAASGLQAVGPRGERLR